MKKLTVALATGLAAASVGLASLTNVSPAVSLAGCGDGWYWNSNTNSCVPNGFPSDPPTDASPLTVDTSTATSVSTDTQRSRHERFHDSRGYGEFVRYASDGGGLGILGDSVGGAFAALTAAGNDNHKARCANREFAAPQLLLPAADDRGCVRHTRAWIPRPQPNGS